MNKNFNIMILIVLGITAIVSGFIGYSFFPESGRLFAQTIFSSISLIGAIILIIIYFRIIRVRKTKFTIGIMVVAVSLMVSSIIDNPIRREFIRFTQSEYAWFFVLETIVSSITVLALLYLAKE